MAGKGHAGETSRGQTKVKPISKDEGFKRLKELEEGGGSNKALTTSVSKIQKVVFLLRDHQKFEKYFEPRTVSLGPIHHGTERLQLAEGYKLRLAYVFIKESDRDENYLYNKVEEKIDELRECFDKEVTEEIDNEALAWMLFVDGCAILQFIYCDVHGKFKELGLKRDNVAFGLRDLFLLENQLPYRLLELLMSGSDKQTELRKSIDTFIDCKIYTTPPHRQWMRSLFCRLRREKRKEGEKTHSPDPEHSITIEFGEPTHLLDLLRTRLLGPKTDNPAPNIQNNQYGRQSYRNVQELRASGIRLQPSKPSVLRNISFTGFLNFYPGYLKLPHIRVDDSTGPEFMNLIAYEMCPDYDNDFDVSSYISFIDSLIAQPNDVQELRKAGILHNYLGSDEEVAQLFNEIGTYLVPSPDAYKDVKHKMQKYYNNKMTLYFHEHAYKKYFNSRTLWAVIGALLGLGLSAAQVYFAVHPRPP